MEMYDIKTIEYNGRPLFQSSKMVSPSRLKGSLQEVACFIYITKGRGQVIESSGKYDLSPEEAIVKSCGNFISNYLKDDSGNDFEAFVIYFYPDILKELYTELVPKAISFESAQPPKKIISNEFIAKYIDGLNLYFENSEMLDESLMRHKMKELVIILLKSNYYDGIIDLFTSLFSPRQKTFHQIIENNIFNPLSIEELAFLTHRSLSTFKRDFKKEFNETPARYIKRKRLEKAAEQLIATDDSISNIAYDCGFQDLSTFSSVFKEFHQLNPTEFRLNQIPKSMN